MRDMPFDYRRPPDLPRDGRPPFGVERAYHRLTLKVRPCQRSTAEKQGGSMHSQIALPVAACTTWRAGDEEAAPPVGFIEPQLRRRLSLLDRIALHVAHACVKDGEAVRVVFASRHGELARSAELLAQLAAAEMPSPMAFSLSVLN